MNSIILTAGKLDGNLIQIFGDLPTGLVPVNGKPLLFYILQNHVQSDIEKIFIVVGYKKDAVKEYVTIFFGQTDRIQFIESDYLSSPGNSLLKALRETPDEKVIINLADTYIPLQEFNAITALDDTLVTSEGSEIDEYSKWSVVKKNTAGAIVKILEKEEISDNKAEILVGLYILNSPKKLLNITDEHARIELSVLLNEYIKEVAVKTRAIDNWYDFGHLDNYQKSKKRLLESRSFNSLEFDDVFGTITKRSTNIEKFTNEIDWQIKLPKPVNILFPRIIDYSFASTNLFITMEYYSYPTVAEIWLYSDFSDKIIKSMVNRLWLILHEFYKIKGYVSKESYKLMYIEKTEKRLDDLLKSNLVLETIFANKSIIINGKKLCNWNELKHNIYSRIDALYNTEHNCLIHGDYCFSNILFDISSGIVRIIDPRGSWGNEIFGDLKYDIAKLRHSISGGYDFIINDLFRLDYSDNSITYYIFNEKKYSHVKEYFDTLVSEKFELKDIKLIEGLLFMSMIPFHSNNLRRQIVMYAKALEILNDI
jgi:NDP-sugar pyrophosphorylase family protein